MKKTTTVLAGVVFLGFLLIFSGIGHASQAGEAADTAEKMIKDIEDLLAINPNFAMDAAGKTWGDNYWCSHFTKGKTNMVHWAKDPSQDDADIIMFVHAGTFLEMGLEPDELPQLTEPPFGSGLTSGQWYYIPKHKLLALPIKVEDAGHKGSIVVK